jgi:hypothetical protein
MYHTVSHIIIIIFLYYIKEKRYIDRSLPYHILENQFRLYKHLQHCHSFLQYRNIIIFMIISSATFLSLFWFTLVSIPLALVWSVQFGLHYQSLPVLINEDLVYQRNFSNKVFWSSFSSRTTSVKIIQFSKKKN